MSVGPMGAAANFAGIPLAQTRGSEAERAAQQSQAHERQVLSEQQAADAAGIAASESDDNQPQERDADGRRLWERPAPANEVDAIADDVLSSEASRDPASESGTQLDLTG